MSRSETWSLLDNFFSSQRPLFSLSTRIWSPPVDVSEMPDRVWIRMEIAGVKREELSVSFENGVLSIRGRRRDRTPSEQEDLLVMEIRYGFFERAFRLPDDIAPEGIKACYRDGFLEIELPKGAGSVESIRVPVCGEEEA